MGTDGIGVEGTTGEIGITTITTGTIGTTINDRGTIPGATTQGHVQGRDRSPMTEIAQGLVRTLVQDLGAAADPGPTIVDEGPATPRTVVSSRDLALRQEQRKDKRNNASLARRKQ